MESIFEKLGIQLSENGDSSTSILIIKNPDGTPRWICNAKSGKPVFLKFYLASTLRSWIFATFIRLVFLLGIQRFVFDTTEIRYDKKYSGGRRLFNPDSIRWAVFTGTPGPNNKFLVFKENKSGGSFFKVANTLNSRRLIENEASVTSMLDGLNPTSFCYPSATKVSKNIVRFSDISAYGKRSGYLTEKHKIVLRELQEKTQITLDTDLLPIIKQSEKKLEYLESINDKRMPEGIIRKLRLMQKGITNQSINVALCHGDFTPWNMYENKIGLSIYDWELSNPLTPIGFDAFHFIFQQGILVDRTAWVKIRSEIDKQFADKFLKISDDELKKYLELYLWINTISNLHLFAKQANWHLQIHWLIDTWNDALSDCMSSQKSNRELVIMDVFDLMYKHEYAAVKFPRSIPESLSELSDIDLLVSKKNAAKMIKVLKSHPLVDQIKSDNKSFMGSYLLFLKDGSLLAIDLIWKFKRKSLQLLDLNKIRSQAKEVIHGVRHINNPDLARYVGLFYSLNGAKVPEKYKDVITLLNKGGQSLDSEILSATKTNNAEPLINGLRNMPHNKGFNRVRNLISYYLDTVRSLFSFNGLIITFSGVDGAGKSTIIENLKVELEKRLRRRVVVLRHRPSLLPILSAWTLGREKAEQEAAERLPRQGNNNSSIGSFLRFAYYYVDYLFGQFYVWVKYTLRGHIVLYDRYYFDFINDSKRSNISIPRSMAAFGYNALLKPHLNFFLYADPNVILMRKQELDKGTIVELTNSYLSLFERLNSGSAERYFPIKNNDLRNTLDIILNKTLAKVA